MGRRATAWATAALLPALLGLVAPAGAVPRETLDSVVSVLPYWPNPGARRQEPEGSGVAILEGGYIATNAHVLGEARKVDVRLADGRVVPAEIVGRDIATDLALLKAPVDLPLLPPGPEPALGAPVCAIGNQFGLGLSLTCGVVSAVRRTGTGFNPVEDFIQTDATVNPGGSGGALIDAEGRLIGLVSAIFTKQSDADIGINFAASRALVERVVSDLRDFGGVKRARLGIEMTSLSRPERRERVGARVTGVADESPAAVAGIQAGDLITEVAGRAVQEPGEVTAAVELHRPGDKVEIVLLREGRRLAVPVILGE